MSRATLYLVSESRRQVLQGFQREIKENHERVDQLFSHYSKWQPPRMDSPGGSGQVRLTVSLLSVLPSLFALK